MKFSLVVTILGYVKLISFNVIQVISLCINDIRNKIFGYCKTILQIKWKGKVHHSMVYWLLRHYHSYLKVSLLTCSLSKI